MRPDNTRFQPFLPSVKSQSLLITLNVIGGKLSLSTDPLFMAGLTFLISQIFRLGVDITLANLSILKTGKAKAVRFSTLEAICKALDCQPGDLLEFRE